MTGKKLNTGGHYKVYEPQRHWGRKKENHTVQPHLQGIFRIEVNKHRERRELARSWMKGKWS